MTAKKMSVRDAEQLIKRIKSSTSENKFKNSKSKVKSGDILRIEEELSDLLTATVEVSVKKKIKRHGKTQEMGELTIQFGSLDELNGLIDKLRAIVS